jgi:hypothetical protein
LLSSKIITRTIKSRRMKWTADITCTAEKRCEVVVGETEGKRPLGMRRHGWYEVPISNFGGKMANVKDIHLNTD